jgi:hypothetical protein
VPAKSRRNKVCDAEDVETATKNNSRESVKSGAVVCDVGFVNGEMRGDGTLGTLFREDFRCRGLTNLLSSCKSVALSVPNIFHPQLSGIVFPYLRCIKRPGAFSRKAGAAARRRPSWNTRIEDILLDRCRLNGGGGKSVVGGNGEVVAVRHVCNGAFRRLLSTLPR